MIRLARHALDHPTVWLVAILLVSCAIGTGIVRLELRTDGDALHPTHDPTIVQTEDDKLIFHDPTQLILLASTRPGGPLIESPEGFRFLLLAGYLLSSSVLLFRL